MVKVPKELTTDLETAFSGEFVAIREATLFSASLTCSLVGDGEARARQALATPSDNIVFSGKFSTTKFPTDVGAHYVLNVTAYTSVLEVSIRATYFAVLDLSFPDDESVLEDLFRNIGSVIIWPKFRDLCTQMISQSGLDLYPFPPTYESFVFDRKTT